MYRIFGPPLPFAAATGNGYEAVEVKSDPALRDRHLAQTSDLAARLRAFAPDLLLVDLFWAPLYWVLPGLDCETWLLVRTCPPVWLAGPPEAPFDPARFARIIGIEPVSYPALDASVEPIVIANPDECRPPEALRQHLAVPPGRCLVVLLHAGERGEVEELRGHAPAGPAAVLDLFDSQALFPAAEWLAGADRIVCGAGYNAYWEARWLGYAGRTTFVPFRRSIDDQAARLADFGGHVPRENGADQLARWIVGGAAR